jgi:DNA primase
MDAWLFIDSLTQTWRCTGCGAGGDVFAFAYAYLGLQHRDLLSFLAVEAGMPLLSQEKVDDL